MGEVLRKTISAPLDIFRKYTEADLYRQAFRLRFPKEVEAHFAEYYHNKTIIFDRWAIVVGIFLYLLGMIDDVTLFPGVTWITLPVRIAFCVFALMILLLSFIRSFKPYLRIALFVISVLASCGLVAMTYIGTGVPSLLYHSGVMLCLTFTFYFIKIRFRLATLSGLIVCLSYAVPHLILGDISMQNLVHNAVNIFGIAVVGMTIAYIDEYSFRYTFVQSLLIDDRNNALYERNEIIEKDMEMAKIIQQQYIPKTLPADYLYVLYRPMEKIGGDFYEFITYDDPDKLGIFISDVSGHGVSAALITSMLKIIINSLKEIKDDPARLLVNINDHLRHFIGGGYITCIYGIVERKNRRFRYSCAGHCPPYIIAGDSVTMVQPGKSFPLGVVESEKLKEMSKTFQEQQVDLPRGGKLFLYTDGLTEASKMSNDEMMFEYHGLHDSFRKLSDAPSKKFTRELYQSLVDFRGSDIFDDDICIICVDIE